MPYKPIRIVVGIPTLNEEKSVGLVVKQVDQGLRKFYPNTENLIVNVDSNSEDKTKDVFLKTRTSCTKKYINAGKTLRGKGKNIIELFKYCECQGVDYIALLDGDIMTVKPSWIFSLLDPLITKGFDYVSPVYSRSCYDGNVTNNFAYPLTFAIFGVNLQQPIGGEFGLNKRLYEYLLKQPTSKAILGFGIDVFMTYHALGGRFSVCEAYLGEKKHRPGFPTLIGKFRQFFEASVEVGRVYKNKFGNVKPVKDYKNVSIFKTKKRPNQNLVNTQLRHYKKEFENNLSEYNKYLEKELIERLTKTIRVNGKPELSLSDWVNTLAKFVDICFKKQFDIESTPKLCHLIEPIFYWRAISFWEEMKHLTPPKIDKEIKDQGELLQKTLIDNN